MDVDEPTPDHAPEAWRKSSYSSGNHNCVEVAIGNAGIGVRDSKLGATSPVLAFGHGAFADFLAAIKDGKSARSRPSRCAFRTSGHDPRSDGMEYDDFRPVRWRKSSYSTGNGGICVEVASTPAGTGIRDSKLGASGPVLAFEHRSFAGFIAAVKDGRFGR